MRFATLLLFAVSCTAFAQGTFKIQSLGTTATQIGEHFDITGDTNGALAISASSVYYNGDTATGEFGINLPKVGEKLTGEASATRYWALVSDLADGSVYTFTSRGGGPINDTILTPGNINSRPLTHLKNISNGNGVGLSQPIALTSSASIFAGYGRVVITQGTTVYDIALPSGTVTLTTLPSALPAVACEQWMSWGVAEYFDNALHVAYVRTNRIISRTRCRMELLPIS